MFEFLRKLFGGGQPPEPVFVETPSPNRIVPAEPKADAAVQGSGSDGTKYVIVGAGPAGIIAAETLRDIDPAGNIRIINGEPEPPYSRMAIPYYLTGQIAEGGTHLRKTPGYFESKRIRVGEGWVQQVEPGVGRLMLHGGEAVPFDRLLLATGATPIQPPIEGLESPGVHPCWTLEDARHIIRLAESGSHVVLLGAGFIGCIILEALAERGVSLTVVEMGDRMVPRMLNAPAGIMLKRWCEAKGVRVRTSTRITKIEPAPVQPDHRDTLLVDLDNGEQLPAHLVVIAAGVRANMDFLEDAGIGTDQGILVNDRLRTNHPQVFAAGDCAQGPDFSTGGRSVHAVQPTAADHGRIAALNMAGRDAPYKGSLVMNVLDTIGLVSCSFGQWEGADGGESAEMADPDGYRYINLQFADDRLVGAITLGRTDWVGVMRGLIQTKVPLGPWKEKLLHDPHRIVEAYVARAGA